MIRIIILWLVFTIVISTSDSFANIIQNYPSELKIEEEVTLFENSVLSLILLEKQYQSIFSEIEYLHEQDEILLKTVDVINWISIFNDSNHLVFKLPIESDHLNISLSGFDPGTYRIEFLMSNAVDVITSRLVINK